MRAEIRSQQRRCNPPVLCISHDPDLGGAGKSILLMIKNFNTVRPIAASVWHGLFLEECRKAGIETVLFLRKDRWYIGIRGKILHFYDDFRNLLQCIRTVRREKIALIHVSGAMTYVLVFGFVGKLMGVPIVWHLRDIPRRYWVQHVTDFLITWFSSAIICISNAVHNHFFSQVRARCRAEVIFNPIDVEELPALPNVVGERVVFGMAGLIAKSKRHSLFLEAAREVCRRRKDAFFLIVGKSRYPCEHLTDDLRRFVEENGLQNVVEFCDWKMNMEDIYGNMNVVVSASKEEGFGRSLIEAMALERPAIAFKRAGPLDIITHGEDGLLVSEDSPKALADAMLYFLEDRNRIVEMGKVARRNVLEKFSVKKHVDRVQSLYTELWGTKKEQ